MNKEKNTKQESGSLCGGIIPESLFEERLKENKVEGIMMAFVMPDGKFKKYYELKEKGEDKEATKLFKKYSWSII